MNKLTAIAWWNALNKEQKWYFLFDARDEVIGGRQRHPYTLTGREIEIIYNFHR